MLLQFAGVNFPGIRVFFDDFVQARLGKSRFIGFVVAVPSVSQQVNEHIGMEVLAVFNRQLNGKYHRFHIICIDVEHRRLGNLGHIRTINAGATFQVVGGKTHLIVDHNV